MNIRVSFLLLAILHLSLSSLEAIDIQTSYPLPSGHIPIAVASSMNGTDVMVASRGSIAVRKEAGEWNFIYTGDANDTFADLTFADGIFVAVGVTEAEGVDQGFALTSSDGETWQRYLIPGARDVTSVTFGKGTFVVSGKLEDERFRENGAATFTSDDAKIWKAHALSDRDSGPSADSVRSPFKVVRFLAGRFIGASDDFYVSDDGVSWTRRGGLPKAGSIEEIAGNGDRLLVAVGKGGVRISKNGGQGWAAVDTPFRWSDVAYCAQKELFVAVGPKDIIVGPLGPKATNGIAISKNGVNWTFVTEQQFLPDAALLTTICDSENGLIAAGPGAAGDGITAIMTSSDGQSWSTQYLSRFIWEGVFAADETFFAAGGAVDPVSPDDPSKVTYRGAILKSTDGLDWEPILEVPVFLRAVAKGGGDLVAVGGTADDGAFEKIYYSTNGHKWESARGTGSSAILHDVAFGNGKFVAVGTSSGTSRQVSSIYFSEARVASWSQARNGSSGTELRAVAYGEPKGVPTFIAVGTGTRNSSALILRSLDGQNWDNVTPGFEPGSKGEKTGLRDVTFADGTFTAVGNGRLCVSKDGQKWDILIPNDNRQMSEVEGGSEDVYIASDIRNNKTGDIHSVLKRLNPTDRRQDGWEFEQIYSLAAKGKTLIAGTDDGISRVVFKPVVTISLAPKYRNGAQENEAKDAAFILTRDEEPSIMNRTETLTVHYQFTGTATPGKDYGAAESGTVEFRGGETRIRVPVTNDAEVENPEDIVCTIVQSPDYVVGSPKRSSITIYSEDEPTCNFLTTSAQVTEGANLEIVVRRNSDIGKTTLKVTAASSSTASPSDYTLEETVVFKPGETTQKLNLRALTDSLGEETESLVLQLTAQGNGKVGIRSSMTISLANAGGNTVTVTATVSGTGEGSPEVGNFRIERTGGTNALSVNFAISGTADNGTDYNLISSPVLIPANVSFVDVGVTPIPDMDVEGDETIVLTLQPAAGYSVGTPVDATVNLLDDDD